MGDTNLHGISQGQLMPLYSMAPRSQETTLPSDMSPDFSKPGETPGAPGIDRSIISTSGNDLKGESALPPEFMDAIKGIPPDRHIKVMLVHGSHTGGHRSAAESVKKALDAMPNVDAEVVNTLDFSGGESVKDAQVAATNFVMEKMAPVRGWVFRQSFKGNPLIYWLGNTAMKFKSWMSSSFLNKINEEKPDIILSCHSPMNSLLSYWKGKGLIDVPVHSVVTDYRVHRMWAQENIDHYYVASEATKDELVNFGIAEDKIEVSGIPIKPDFAQGPGASKAELKKRLGLDPHRPTVLMMGGSLGLGRFDEMAKALDMKKIPAQMVCITGKNETKKAALEELSSELSLPMKALGYVDNVNEWMDASDIIISKPGGLTTSEIFAKKIPMIILDPMPGLEEMLIPTIVDTGAAVSVKGPEKAAQFIEDFFTDPSTQQRFQSSLEKAGKPFAAYEVAADLVDSALDSSGETSRPLHQEKS